MEAAREEPHYVLFSLQESGAGQTRDRRCRGVGLGERLSGRRALFHREGHPGFRKRAVRRTDRSVGCAVRP